MKGITPVIAVILLLMITVSMVGFAFVWFTRIATTAGTNIETRTTQVLSVKSIRVENAKGITVDIRNTGTTAIGENELAFYISDTRNASAVTCGGGGYDSVSPNALITCTFSGTDTCPTGATLRVTVTGGVDVTTCK